MIEQSIHGTVPIPDPHVLRLACLSVVHLPPQITLLFGREVAPDGLVLQSKWRTLRNVLTG